MTLTIENHRSSWPSPWARKFMTLPVSEKVHDPPRETGGSNPIYPKSGDWTSFKFYPSFWSLSILSCIMWIQDNLNKEKVVLWRKTMKIEEPCILFYAIIWESNGLLYDPLRDKGLIVQFQNSEFWITPEIFQNPHTKGTFSFILNGYVQSQTFVEISMKSCIMIFFRAKCPIMRAKSSADCTIIQFCVPPQRGFGCHPENFSNLCVKFCIFVHFEWV